MHRAGAQVHRIELCSSSDDDEPQRVDLGQPRRSSTGGGPARTQPQLVDLTLDLSARPQCIEIPDSPDRDGGPQDGQSQPAPSPHSSPSSPEVPSWGRTAPWPSARQDRQQQLRQHHDQQLPEPAASASRPFAVPQHQASGTGRPQLPKQAPLLQDHGEPSHVQSTHPAAKQPDARRQPAHLRLTESAASQPTAQVLLQQALHTPPQSAGPLAAQSSSSSLSSSSLKRRASVQATSPHRVHAKRPCQHAASAPQGLSARQQSQQQATQTSPSLQNPAAQQGSFGGGQALSGSAAPGLSAAGNTAASIVQYSPGALPPMHALPSQAHNSGSPGPAPDLAQEPGPNSRPQRSPAWHSPTSSRQAQPEHNLYVELSGGPSPVLAEVQGPSAQPRSCSSHAPPQPQTSPSLAPQHAQQHTDQSCRACAGSHLSAEPAADLLHKASGSPPQPEVPASEQPASGPPTAVSEAPQPDGGPGLPEQPHLPPQPATRSALGTAAALPAVQSQHAPKLAVTDHSCRLPGKPQLPSPGHRTPAGAANASAAAAPTAPQQAPTAAESHPCLQQPRPASALPPHLQPAVLLQAFAAPALLLPNAGQATTPTAALAAAAAAAQPAAPAAPGAGTKAAAAKRAQQARRRVLHSSSDESEAESSPDSELDSRPDTASESESESEVESEQGSAYEPASLQQEAAPEAPGSLPRLNSEPSSVSIGGYRPSSASTVTSIPVPGLLAPASGQHHALAPEPAQPASQGEHGAAVRRRGTRIRRQAQDIQVSTAPTHKRAPKPKVMVKPAEVDSLLVGPQYQAVLPNLQQRPELPSSRERSHTVACICNPGQYGPPDAPAPIVSLDHRVYEVQLPGQLRKYLAGDHAEALGLTKMGAADAQGWTTHATQSFAAGPPWPPKPTVVGPDGKTTLLLGPGALPGVRHQLTSFFYNWCRPRWGKAQRTLAKAWFQHLSTHGWWSFHNAESDED